MCEMQMQRLCMILNIARLGRAGRGEDVRRVCVGLAVGWRRRVQSLWGREVSNVLVLRQVVLPSSTPVVSVPIVLRGLGAVVSRPLRPTTGARSLR